MAKTAAYQPATYGFIDRPVHLVDPDADSYAIAFDPSGKLHFDSGRLDGDHVIVLLGHDISDAHLAELAADGVSYIVAEAGEIDLAAMLATLGSEFDIQRLALEDGGGINGAFFAARLVDELSVLIAPPVDGTSSTRAIIDSGDEGLADTVRLALRSAETLDFGAVHLRYIVSKD